MKRFLPGLQGRSMHLILICLVFTMVCFNSCRKSGEDFRDELDRSSFSSDVIDKWLTLEIRLFTHATGISNGGFARPFAYSGISAYESLDPGVASWKNKYNGLSGLPETEKHRKYYWPESVNASLAAFNRNFFTTVNSNSADIAAIDSLENAINSAFNHISHEILSR
ncbi:MAG TPA: hypothetical protein VK588_04160, partial [Chitinophagaceae bacterium]|nr:hypothetical protein [Chitinophagaceae bacterium]